jgi:hypothetical protein
MKVQIVAVAPTTYQINSIRALSGIRGFESQPDGSFEFKAIFSSKSDAIKYLKNRAYTLFQDQLEYREAIAEINNYGMLTYDAVTARIEKI